MTISSEGRPATFSGRRASQSALELGLFIDALRQRGVRSYLEIGARHGDTFHAVMSALPAGSRGLAIDLPGGVWGVGSSAAALERAIGDLRARGIDCEMQLGDCADPVILSYVARLAPFDAVLIDGDHRYEGVSRDWVNYGPLAGIVAFHDIAGTGERAGDSIVEVPRLWAELKAEHPGEALEIIDPAFRMGIGLLLPA